MYKVFGQDGLMDSSFFFDPPTIPRIISPNSAQAGRALHSLGRPSHGPARPDRLEGWPSDLGGRPSPGPDHWAPTLASRPAQAEMGPLGPQERARMTSQARSRAHTRGLARTSPDGPRLRTAALSLVDRSRPIGLS